MAERYRWSDIAQSVCGNERQRDRAERELNVVFVSNFRLYGCSQSISIEGRRRADVSYDKDDEVK